MKDYMSKTCLKISLGVVVVLGLTLAASAAAPETVKQLSGHVPSIVSHLSSVGRLNATNRLHLSIGLPLRNREAITNLLQQINDPSSQNYHHYLTPEQFTEQFGPTEQDYQAVQEFARTNGLTITHVPGNRMLVEADGQASEVEHAFNITLHTYRHPTENRDFFAPDTEPSVPAKLSILDVSGLSSYSRPQSFRQPKSAKSFTTKTASGKPFAGSAPDGTSYMGYDYRKAYVPGTTLTGAGQKIALLQFDGYFPSDIAAYQRLTGLPSISITNILLDGFDGNPTLTGGEGEVELDIEMVNSWAPGLSQLLVYEENPNVFNPVTVLNRIAMDNAAKQVSSSWGWGVPPSGSGTINQILQQMILQGQSFFQASGDSDAYLPGQADNQNGLFGNCCNPYLTSVGGTKLFTDAGGNYTSESVWNDRTPNNGQGGDWGSGGGISTFYFTPFWQAGFGTTTNHGSATGRNFPDVALPAEDVYVVLDGLAQASGGTSAAAPAWAGFMALVNQQGALNGRTPVGFLNPVIYALANTAAYNNCFHDTTNGDNTWPGSPTNFFAVPGFDLCTGLGTPNGINLINALTTLGGSNTPPTISAPARPWGTNLAAMNGSNPNGAWFLFVQDDAPLNVGTISGGWCVTLTTAYPVGFAADNELSVTPATVTNTPSAYWPVTLTVTNYGPSSSTNVSVTDTLPSPGAGVSLASFNASVGSVTVLGNTLTWTAGNLAISNSASLTLNFYAASNAFGLYTNSAVVHATTSDPNFDDDAGAATLLVSGAAPAPPALTPSYNPGSGIFQLTVNGSAGQSVIVQSSTNLVNWIPISTNLVPFTNAYTTTNFPMQFYRAVVGP